MEFLYNIHMAFHKYQTEYEIQKPGISADKFYDQTLMKHHQSGFLSGTLAPNSLIAGGFPSEVAEGLFLMQHSEFSYFLNRKPSYKIYPGVDLALASTRIDIPLMELNLPFDAFSINFHTSSNMMYEGIKICSILVSWWDRSNSGDRGILSIIIETIDGVRRVLNLGIQKDENITIEQFLIRRFDWSNYVCPVVLRPVLGQATWTVSEEIFHGPVRSPSDYLRILTVVFGVCFLAISKDRRYIKKHVIKIRGNDLCFCGSNKKYKKCCKLKGIQNVGYQVGKEILLPTKQTPGTSHVVVGRGKELAFGHIRSGHMRWQWYNDAGGNRRRKLIFIHPAIVRPDLPPKPRLTPRRIPNPDANGFCPICGCCD
jgi:hypothetical protein